MKNSGRLFVLALLGMILAAAFPMAGFVPTANAQSSDEVVMDLEISDIYCGLTLTWVSAEKMPAHVIWGFSESGLSNQAYDVRGEDVESFTHMCRIDVSYNDMGSTVYYQIVYGDGNVYPPDGPMNFTVPVLDSEPPTPGVVYGTVNTTFGPVDGIILRASVERNGNASSLVAAMTDDKGRYSLDMSLAVLDGNFYRPQVGDVIHIDVQGGPYGTYSTTATVSSSDLVDGSLYMHGPDITLSLPFSVSNLSVSPESGNENTNFTFSVVYTASDSIGPDSIVLYIDGTPHNMTPEGGDFIHGATYTYSTRLSAGDHTFYVVVERGGLTVSTENMAGGHGTVTVSSASEQPGGGGGGTGTFPWLYAGVVVVVVVALTLGYLLYRRRNG